VNPRNAIVVRRRDMDAKELAFLIKKLKNTARLMEQQLAQFARPKPKEKKSA
jgi:hypothetical protein